jgi:chromatin structure-remodeling complex subunit RSC9
LKNTIDGEGRFSRRLVAVANGHSTTLDPSPKVGPAHLDLLRLYKRVTAEGGYDRMSDTRGNKLAWRRLAMEFLPHTNNMVQFAFQVKTAYYKNLAYVDAVAVPCLTACSAYEISTFHKREPPPKEILEDLTAKGGDLLNRTLENYHRRANNRDVDNLANGAESDTESNEHHTPKADRMDLDDAPGSSGRITRGTRLQPPTRLPNSLQQVCATPRRSAFSSASSRNTAQGTRGGHRTIRQPRRKTASTAHPVQRYPSPRTSRDP